MGEHLPEDDDPPMICPVSGTYCVRAFCDDYGCADKAGVPIDAHDFACGSIDPDELIMPMPRPAARQKR